MGKYENMINCLGQSVKNWANNLLNADEFDMELLADLNFFINLMYKDLDHFYESATVYTLQRYELELYTINQKLKDLKFFSELFNDYLNEKINYTDFIQNKTSKNIFSNWDRVRYIA